MKAIKTKGKYCFKDASENYPVLFNKEKKKLQKMLPKDAEIEHIGSTAVPGLGGKGILDIAIAVDKKDLIKTINKLEFLKYDYKPSAGDKERKFLQKIIKHKRKEKRIHIQLTGHNSYTWKAAVAVRDYLKNNPKTVEKYSKIKKEAVKYAKGIGQKYRDYKKRFLDTLEKKALKEAK